MRKAELRTKFRKAKNKTCHCLRSAAWQACKVTCWIACAPCLCCALLFIRPRHRRSHARDPFNPIYPDLPAPRRRALSLPLLHPQAEQGTVDQAQSLFMTKLPLEVRRLVYAHVLGGKAVHVMNVDGRLCARRCLKVVQGRCECGYFDPLEEGELEFGVGILGSCRQIYSESVEFLYSSNAFSISTDRDDLPTLDYLSYWILPQRIQQIRTLRIHWEMDSIPYYHLMTASPEPVLDQWINSWETLGQLKGLRHLHVNLVFRYTHWAEYYDEIWKIHGAGLLQSIKKVTAPLDFVVVLPNRKCAIDVDLGDSRCVIKLPEGEGTMSESDD